MKSTAKPEQNRKTGAEVRVTNVAERMKSGLNMGARLVCIFQLLAILSIVAAKRFTGFPCPQECNCGPSTDGDLNILCSENDTTILHVDVSFGNFIKVDCSIGSTNYSLLDFLKVGPVQLVRFQFCPLSDSLLSLTEKLNISGVRILSFGHLGPTTIEKEHLKNFANISQLSLQYSEVTTLPNNLLEHVTQLKRLDLLSNKLQSIPPGFFDTVTNLTFLELGANIISHLEPNTFHKLSQLRLLNLWGNSLQSLSRTVFSGLTSLVSLDLHSSKIRTLAAEVFDDIPNLKQVSLFNNNFSTLPEGLFNKTPQIEILKLFNNYQRLLLPSGMLSNLSNLTKVYLHTNNMSYVPGDLLKGSKAITTIRLERNALKELPLELFSDAVELLELDVSSNQLTSLPEELFASLSKLKVLKLANNQFTTIQQSVFKQLVKLEELNLERNRLVYIHPKAFPTGRNCQIKKLFLAHNYMTMQEEDTSNIFGPQSVLNSCLSFKELYLANNSITDIFTDWRQVMLSLEKLDLSNNNISLIRSDDLQFLSNKLKINLSNNKIYYVDMQNIETLVKLFQPTGTSQVMRDVQVILKGNPIRCDCHAYTLLQYIEGMLSKDVYNFIHLITDNLMCSSPPVVSGVSVSQIKSRTVTCDVTDVKSIKCPNPCICLSRTDDSAFIVDCAGLGLLQAPEQVPWTPLMKHYEIHLENNRLNALPDLSQPGYDKVTKIFAAYNNISKLDQHNLSPSLEVLELNGNKLTHIPTSAMDVLLQNTTQLQRLRIDNNPWRCDCTARDLLNYLQVHFRQVAFLSNVTCSDGQAVSQLSANELCPVSNAWIIALSTSIALIGIALGTLAALYYRYQHEVKVWLYAKQLCLWFVTEEELDKDKHYDAFISYSHNDEDFVVNHLVPGLESGPTPFKLCLHFRDWIPGEWITSQIARSVEDSRRTIVVLSPNFLESIWGRMEFRAAHKQALSDGRARVILLIYGELGPIDSLDTELRTYLSTNTYVKWGDPWFWRKLRYALPHPAQSENTEPICALPKSHTNAAFEDKLELMQPTTPTPTTPPADSIIDPMTRVSNGVTPLPLLNGLNAKLILETNNLVNGCVKSV